MIYFIYNFTFISHGFLTTHKLPAPNVSDFIAHLVRASHQYYEVTDSNPVEALNFSGFYIRNCINCVHNCEDHSLLDFTSAVQYMKCFIYNFTTSRFVFAVFVIMQMPRKLLLYFIVEERKRGFRAKKREIVQL